MPRCPHNCCRWEASPVGHRAEAFASAETLLLSPDLLNFDRVIADVHMPGMSGLNLVRKLRIKAARPP
jgi:FixJ family two-component response regulator